MKRPVSTILPLNRGVAKFYNYAMLFSLLTLLSISNSNAATMAPPGPCPGGAGVLGGTVFTDFNFNGIDDEDGLGLEAIEVFLYESTGAGNASALISSTTTDANGEYFFSGLTDGVRYRVEFVAPPALDYLKPSPNGTDSRTTVQYPMSPDCNVDLGLACPADFCGEDNEVNFFTPCYIAGDPLAGGNAGTDPGIVSVAYDASGMNMNTTVLDAKDVGTLWGLAYQRTSGLLFGASTLRRHSGFGPGGTGGIYVIDANNPASSSILDIIDLDALGFDTGTDPRIGNPLPATKQLPSHDTDAYGLIGKMSLGDIEISEDNKELWVINLFDKTLNKIALSDPYVAPTATDVTSMPIPDPGCVGGEHRPWAVKYYKGKVYVGVVCDASVSQDNDDLHAYIYVHDPAGAAGNFTPVFDFDLSFQRGYVSAPSPGVNQWYPWTDNHVLAEVDGFFQRPQPILADIEFDADGSLVLGFLDRMGQQGGFSTFSPDPNDFDYYDTYSGGDIIRVCNIGGTYTLEGNTGCTTAGGLGNNQGPNGSEYYFSDIFQNPSTSPFHQEIALGGLAIKPGSGEVISTVFDPLSNVNTGGVTWFDNATGERNRSYQIYDGSLGFSGKANGLGDLEIGCQSAPIEIGNYVWYDPNMDGIQDPAETPIPGVDIALYATDGTIVDVTTTDANGEYYFSSLTSDLTFNTDYYILVGYNQFNTSTQTLFDTLTLTIDSMGMNVDPNLNDSDGVIGSGNVPSYLFGFPYTPVTTGGPGCNDHSLDFGFFGASACVLTLDAVVVQNESCVGASNGEITITTTPTTGVEYSIDGGITFSGTNTFTGLAPGIYNVVVVEIANPACRRTAVVEILSEMEIDPPSDVEGYKLCIDQTVPASEGLTATCTITCSADSTQRTTWWTAEMGGSMVATGSVFDPVGAGLVDNAIPDTTTYYVQCECGVCVSERVPAEFIVLSVTPTEIDGAAFVCPGEITVFNLVNDFGNEATWTLSGGGTIIAQDDISVTIEWETGQGTGPFTVTVFETTENGCVTSDAIEVTLKNTTIACNNNVQISLDENGEAIITPDLILEGTYNTFDCFDVNIEFNGTPIGNIADCRFIGQNLTINVSGGCDGNSCWGSALIEDKKPPVIMCPPMTDTVEVNCSIDPNLIAAPTATDNCSIPVVNLIEEEKFDDDDCLETVIKRTYQASDDFGNVSQLCMTFIKVLLPSDPEFPDDVTWTCEQYAAFPNIVEPTALHQCILDNVEAIDTAMLYCTYPNGDDVPFVTPYHSIYRYWKDNEGLDVTLDPNYDDNIDNPLTDTNAAFGTPTVETDDPNICNLSIGLCPAFDTIIDNAGHYPDTIITPIYRPIDASGNPVNGLEDADILEMTGSGVPNYGVHGACPYVVTYRDEKGATCDGVDTTVMFKIFRTWTLTNWCTGEQISDLQIIKVVDKVRPTIIAEPFEITADYSVVTQDESICTSTGLIPAPIAFDNCDKNLFIQIFTPIGEAIYVNGVDGREGGYIPNPGLEYGTHEIIYQATDACANQTKVAVEITVVDNISPTMICREFTDISLTLDGTAIVCADKFDEGIHDNCGIDSLFIKRMNEPDSLYRECLNFTCDDACGDTSIMVILKAYDFSGNSNECMVEAKIYDKLGPTCEAPEDVWIDCDEITLQDLTDTLVLQEHFGYATYVDNCGAHNEELEPRVELDQCGAGTIVRTFKAIDKNGNVSRNSCRQTIMVQPKNEYMIQFPADWDGECGEMEEAPEVTFMEMACDQIATYHEDLRFDISTDGACYKIIRTWYVMNWCAYDGISAPIEVPNDARGVKISHEDYNAFGYYTYKQIIRVKDQTAPVISYDGPVEFCSTNRFCDIKEGTYSIYPTDIDEECTTDLTVRWKFDLGANGTYDSEGYDAFSKTLPLGKHSITFLAIDGCGNTGTHSFEFEVKDCKKPTPVCHNGLSAELMQDGTLEIWAIDFDASSFDFCTDEDDLKFRMNRITDVNGDGLVTADDYQMNVPTTAAVGFNCDDRGLQMVQMWVGDDADNWDFCVTFIDIQDNMSVCSSTLKMAGNIETIKGEGVMDVKVELSGNNTTSLMTDENGMFEFGGLTEQNDYTITPIKNTDAANGVSTFDIYLISQHVLQTRQLPTPYHLIAADANRTGTITTLDIVAIRKVILRINNEFTNNTSWRFVEKDYIFPDPKAPFGFPEVINYNNLSTSELSSNFVAVKIGDVNGDAQTGSLKSIDDRTNGLQVVNVENSTLKAGAAQTIRFEVEDAADLFGYQFTLEFDSDMVQFENIVENDFVKMSNFGFAMVDEGIITTSWNANHAPEELFFELTFRATNDIDLKEVLKITSEYTTAEAFNAEGELKDVELRFNGEAIAQDAFSLYQNKPNPFSKGTLIGFELPEASEATLSIFDISGKLIKTQTENYPKGYNEISISRTDLNAKGVYYYRLETADNSATRKMMLLD